MKLLKKEQIVDRFKLIGPSFVFLVCFLGLSNLSWSQSNPASPTPKVPPETIVVQVGNVQVTAGEVERILQSMPPQYRPYYSGPGRRQFAGIIVKNKLLLREAESHHLENNEVVQLDLRISREAILSNAASRELDSQTKVSDAEAQKYLDDHLSQFEEARVSRIVIRSISSIPYGTVPENTKQLSDQEAREKAEEIRKKLLEGADFEELAAKFSQDPMSSGRGGSLGFIRRGNKTHLIAPPLEELIFSSKPGTVTDVQQTPLGIEIVKIHEKRVPKLDDVRKEIEPLVRAQKLENWVTEAKKSVEIKIDESYFKPTPASSVQGVHK